MPGTMRIASHNLSKTKKTEPRRILFKKLMISQVCCSTQRCMTHQRQQ